MFCTAIKLLWRKTLIHWRQRKLRLLEGRPALVTFHLFLVGATNIFSELIHPLLKLLNCVLKQQPHILQLSQVIGSGFSLFEEQEQTLSAYCHFHSFIDLPENTTLYTETMLKTALELLEINYVQLSTQDLKLSANNNTHCSLAQTITRYIKFTESGVVNTFFTARRHFWTLGQNELIVWKTVSQMFSLASHYLV